MYYLYPPSDFPELVTHFTSLRICTYRQLSHLCFSPPSSSSPHLLLGLRSLMLENHPERQVALATSINHDAYFQLLSLLLATLQILPEVLWPLPSLPSLESGFLALVWPLVRFQLHCHADVSFSSGLDRWFGKCWLGLSFLPCTGSFRLNHQILSLEKLFLCLHIGQMSFFFF